MTELENPQEEPSTSTSTSSLSTQKISKKHKRGIIYLSTIPPYMNVLQIRAFFGDFGTVGRVYLQLANTDPKPNEDKSKAKSKKRRVSKRFTEGWIEFERKSVAKRVVVLLNNTQVSSRKKSKQFDAMWNMKYLSNFKWTHLHERLAYEKAARRQKLRTEIQLAKKKTNFFTGNLDKGKKKKDGGDKHNQENKVKKQVEKTKTSDVEKSETEKMDETNDNRSEFLESLFT